MRGAEFGSDGIRGLAGEWPLTEEGMLHLARALAKFLHPRSEHPVVILGRDTRRSGLTLSHVLQAGLLREDLDVINLGIMTTPGVAYLTRNQSASLGICVSASHNPPEYNGIKILGPHGLRLTREDEIEIEGLLARFTAEQTTDRPSFGQQIDGHHLVEVYVQDHVQQFPAQSLEGFGVVLDCAHGAAAQVAPQVFRRLGAQVSVVNHDISGECINHGAGSEYARQHPAFLAQLVKRCGAVCGFAFDGDGDRLVVVDAEGAVYDGDDILFALALAFDRRGLLRGRTIVTSHAANKGLDSALAGLGINLVRAGKGDKAIEAAMWRGDYFLGGEQIGNIIINDGHHTAADAVYTAMFLASFMNERDLGLAEMVVPFVKRPQILTLVRYGAAPSLEQSLALQRQKVLSATALGEDARIMAWNSSTEPGVFRIMVEGGAASLIADIRREAVALCQAFQEDLALPDAPLEVFEVSARFRG